MLILVFALGLVVGSFLNVVILRFNTGYGIGGRSACFSCQTKLAWYELLPVVSYVTLKGRCRTCRSKISLQYPLVELLTAIMFALIYIKLQVFGEYALHNGTLFISPFAESILTSVLSVLYYWVIAAILIIITVYDARHKIIPDVFVYAFTLLSGLTIFFNVATFTFERPVLWHALAGPILFTPFYLLWRFSEGRWMGLGDGKLAWGMGWFLGLSSGVAAIVLAFWIATAVSLTLLLLGRLSKLKIFSDYALFRGFKNLTMKSEIPFGPFLVIGLWAMFFFGERILAFFF